MRFLLLTHIFPPATDGGSKIIAKIGEYLKESGNEFLVVTSNCHTTDEFVVPNSRVLNNQSTDVHRLPVYHLHRRLPKPIFKIIPFIMTLISILKFKPDWIIAGPFPTTITLYGLLLKLICKSKLCLIPCFHQYDPEFKQKHLIYCLKHADLICTLTQHELNYFHTQFSISTSKLFLMQAGVDKSFIQPKATKFNNYNPQIIFLGNFSAHKRVELLVEAFSKLKIKNLKLILAGQKTLYWPNIQKVIDSMPTTIKKNIIVHLKNYSTSQLAHFLDSSSILVLPSIHESFGLVFIESMARGIPVIGTDIPPVVELLNTTRGGLLFKQNDCSDLISKISLLLSDQKLYQQCSQKGLRYVASNLTWDTIGKRLWPKFQNQN